jgi:hypothetical protein
MVTEVVSARPIGATSREDLSGTGRMTKPLQNTVEWASELTRLLTVEAATGRPLALDLRIGVLDRHGHGDGLHLEPPAVSRYLNQYGVCAAHVLFE